MIDWIYFLEDSDTKHLQISSKKNRVHSQEAINLLQKDFIKCFGLTLEAQFIFHKKIRIELLEISRSLTKNQSLSSIIAIEIAELSKYLSEDKTDYYQVWADVESVLGFRLDTKNLTVFEFYNYLKKVKKDYENQKKIS
jgi:hypothetical protein